MTMNPIPDLHTHSTASDGTLTPKGLAEHATAMGVQIMALTDHDTTDGLAEASVAAQACGLTLVPGVEISVTWGARTVHVVGLHLDPAEPVLQGGLARLMEFRAWRAEEIGRRLGKHGVADAYEGARALSNGHLIGRTHFARFLVKARLAADTGDVFKRFLTMASRGMCPVSGRRWRRRSAGSAPPVARR